MATIQGLILFQRWHEMNTATKHPKSMNQFIDSPYYKTFIKFARHLMDLCPVDQARFVDYVFRNVRKDKDWCKDYVYEAYIIDYLGKEPADPAFTRSIKTMIEWSEKYNLPFETFFAQVSPPEATHLIKMGKISPWVLLLAPTSDLLWERISDEQWEIIETVIIRKIWQTRFSLRHDDCDFIRDTCREAHI